MRSSHSHSAHRSVTVIIVPHSPPLVIGHRHAISQCRDKGARASQRRKRTEGKQGTVCWPDFNVTWPAWNWRLSLRRLECIHASANDQVDHYDAEKCLLGLLAIFLGALNTHVLGCWADRTGHDQRLMSAWRLSKYFLYKFMCE